MKKIINWTFGGFFRTIGRTIAFLLLGGLIAFFAYKNDIKLSKLIGLDIVYASTETVNYNNVQYRVFYYEDLPGEPTNSTSYINGGTATQLDTNSRFWVYAFNTRLFMGNNTLAANRTYRIMYTYTFSPNDTKFYKDFPNNLKWSIVGNSTSSASGSNEDFINTWSVSVSPVCETCQRFRVYLTVTPATDIKFIQLNMQIPANDLDNGGTGKYSMFNYFNLPTGSSYISIIYNTDESVSAINQQTEDIINNQTQNTNEIINNQTQNTEDIIDSQKYCEFIGKEKIKQTGYYLTRYGVVANTSSDNYGITDYINIYKKDVKVFSPMVNSAGTYYCFYDSYKLLLECFESTVTDFTVPENSVYLRYTSQFNIDKPIFSICANGNQAINESLNDDNVEDSTNKAGDFFSSFTTDSHGLTGIITAPLNAINSLTSATCSPLVIPLPFMSNKNITLPCMRSIYTNNFGGFMNLYDIITTGIIAYWVCVRIFGLVKDFKNPEHDEIEVVDL